MNVNDRFKFRFNPNSAQIATCTATVVKINDDGTVKFRLPRRVLTVPFPPLWVDDKPTRYGVIHISKIPKAAILAEMGDTINMV